ncbi:GIY-YIG nuclease family protein [Mesobacterium pallidum]|uniref:GIY-YIG nuclease family protein n=1 Tax=Mesobacterium pallidum TaxID=2872037 RepID=UPI001EE1C836|nr:GIY-YIG nuclease family protein [Mesobacterium pallidum]
MSAGRSLELYFVDGRPDGMLTAEVFNWTGHVLRIPRTRLADGLKRPQADQTGVYILTGADDDGEMAYVGEAENLAGRLKQHAKSKDWWDEAVLVTTSGDALHKAHVKYLEARMVELALAAGAMRLTNAAAPTRSSLNEAATASMESFLDTLQLVLPAIRVDIFHSGRRPDTPQTEAVVTSPVFMLSMPRSGVEAQAALAGSDFVVKAGSKVRASYIGTHPKNATPAALHRALVQRQIIRVTGNEAVMAEDYAFTSPSAAASVVCGTSTPGPRIWKLPDGRSYADWEAEQMEGDT